MTWGCLGWVWATSEMYTCEPLVLQMAAARWKGDSGRQDWAGLGIRIYPSGPVLICVGQRWECGGKGQLAFLLTHHLHALFPTVIKGDVPKLSKKKSKLLFK